MRKYFLQIGIISCLILSLVGCKKKTVKNPVPEKTGVIKNNLYDIQKRTYNLENFEHVAVLFNYNNQKQQVIFDNKDKVYFKIPNINYSYIGNVLNSDDDIYYIYANTSSDWIQDNLPEGVENELIETKPIQETISKIKVEETKPKKVRIINILDEIEKIEEENE